MYRTLGHHLAILFFLLLTAFPLLLGVGYAMLYSVGMLGVLSNGFTWHHWQLVVSDSNFWYNLLYSLYIAVLSIGLAVGLAFYAVLWKFKQLNKHLSTILYFPLSIPAIVAAFFFFQLLGSAGIVSRLVYALGMVATPADFPVLINDSWGIGIIATHTFMAFPFFTLLFLNIYQQYGLEHYEAVAQTMGASKWQTKLKVHIPILWRQSFSSIVLYLSFVVGSYEIPLLLGRQSPSMLSPYIIRKLQRFNLLDIPQAYAIASLYALGMLLVLWLLVKNNKLGHR